MSLLMTMVIGLGTYWLRSSGAISIILPSMPGTTQSEQFAWLSTLTSVGGLIASIMLLIGIWVLAGNGNKS